MGFALEPRRARGVQSSNDVAAKAEKTWQLVFPRSKSMFYETHRFRRADRILSPRDFKHAVKSGRRGASAAFVVVIAPRPRSAVNELDESRRRLGVTVSKRVGNAVIRNRIKRRIREWFRHARERLPDRSDVVVIARRAARDLSGYEAAEVLNKMIPAARARRAG